MAFATEEDCMAKKHKPEEIVAKLRQVDVLTSQGTPLVDAVRSIGVTEVTYYRWRNEYGGLKSDQVRRLKDLEVCRSASLAARSTWSFPRFKTGPDYAP
jgi:putative transposase